MKHSIILKKAKHEAFLKSTSMLLVFSFLFQELAMANPELPKIAAQKFFEGTGSKTWARKMLPLIPDSVATLEDAYQVPGAKKTVILLQDAHTNNSGQFNAAKTLDLIFKKDPIRYVFLEAGAGDESLSFLRKYAGEPKRQQVASSFVMQGKLQGTEYLDVTSAHDFVLWGVEDMNLYAKSLEAYRAVVKDREKFQAYLSKIETTVKTLKPKVYNPLLLAFDQKYQKFKKEELSLTDYFEALTLQAKNLNLSMNQYPHLGILSSLKNRESKIDFKKASEEQRLAVASLSETEQKDLLVASKEDQALSKASAGSRPSQKAFFALLEEKLKTKGSSYGELFKYFQYLKECSKLSAKDVILEQKNLEKEVFAALAGTDDERNLVLTSRNLRFLKNLFDLKMTPEEFIDYLNERKSFDIQQLTGFLNRKIMDLETYYERAIFLEEGYEDIIRNSETFYTLTYQRDQKFIENLTQKMDAENQDKAILVTGGYHSPNLKQLLKQRGISYINLTPAVYQETNQKRYEKILFESMGWMNGSVSSPGVSPLKMTAGTNMGARLGRESLAVALGARLSPPDSRILPDRDKAQILAMTSVSSGSRLAGGPDGMDRSAGTVFADSGSLAAAKERAMAFHDSFNSRLPWPNIMSVLDASERARIQPNPLWKDWHVSAEAFKNFVESSNSAGDIDLRLKLAAIATLKTRGVLTIIEGYENQGLYEYYRYENSTEIFHRLEFDELSTQDLLEAVVAHSTPALGARLAQSGGVEVDRISQINSSRSVQENLQDIRVILNAQRIKWPTSAQEERIKSNGVLVKELQELLLNLRPEGAYASHSVDEKAIQKLDTLRSTFQSIIAQLTPESERAVEAPAEFAEAAASYGSRLALSEARIALEEKGSFEVRKLVNFMDSFVYPLSNNTDIQTLNNVLGLSENPIGASQSVYAVVSQHRSGLGTVLPWLFAVGSSSTDGSRSVRPIKFVNPGVFAPEQAQGGFDGVLAKLRTEQPFNRFTPEEEVRVFGVTASYDPRTQGFILRTSGSRAATQAPTDGNEAAITFPINESRRVVGNKEGAPVDRFVVRVDTDSTNLDSLNQALGLSENPIGQGSTVYLFWSSKGAKDKKEDALVSLFVAEETDGGKPRFRAILPGDPKGLTFSERQRFSPRSALKTVNRDLRDSGLKGFGEAFPSENFNLEPINNVQVDVDPELGFILKPTRSQLGEENIPASASATNALADSSLSPSAPRGARLAQTFTDAEKARLVKSIRFLFPSDKRKAAKNILDFVSKNTFVDKNGVPQEVKIETLIAFAEQLLGWFSPIAGFKDEALGNSKKFTDKLAGHIQARGLTIQSSAAGSRLATQTVPEADLNHPIAFGTSGWRATTKPGNFSRPNVGRFAQGAANYFNSLPEDQRPKRIAVGYDARPGAGEYAKHLVEVLAANGFHADLIDQINPTPIILESTRLGLPADKRYDFAFQVTASHNALFESVGSEDMWLGIKAAQNGVPAPDNVTEGIKNFANNRQLNGTYNYIPYGEISSLTTRGVDLQKESRERLAQAFDFKKLSQIPFKLVTDSMHGGTVQAAQILQELGIVNTMLRTEPMQDGLTQGLIPSQITDNRGNALPWRPEPLEFLLEEFLQKTTQGNFGAAYDGDGDRAVFKDISGRILTPNEIGLVFLNYLHKRGENGVVVRTLPTSEVLDAYARRNNLQVIETPVGSKYFSPQTTTSAEDDQLIVAVEESGHIFFKKNGQIFADSAIAETFLALEIIQETGKSLAENLSDIYKELGFQSHYVRTEVNPSLVTPEFKRTLENIRVDNKFTDQVARQFSTALALRMGLDLKEDAPYDLRDAKSGIKVKFKNGSWAMFRMSGTEPVIRIYAESMTSADEMNALTREVESLIVEMVGSASTTPTGARLAKTAEGILTSSVEKQRAEVLREKLTAPLTSQDPRLLQSGAGQIGLGVPAGAAVNGTLALAGSQGYYTSSGKEIFLKTVADMRTLFSKRKPRVIIKIGIGGQHTPFQGIADVFQAVDPDSGVILGEYELGKDYEASLQAVLNRLGATWDQIVVIPSSKSGSTDETMVIFGDILKILLKHAAIRQGLNTDNAAAFADRVESSLNALNVADGKERKGAELFKNEQESLMDRLAREAHLGLAQVKNIFASVLGNMFFETTDRPDQSRLSAFVRNSGLDKELGDDSPGFGAMFDNVGGRWTGDLHMMAFLAFYGLDAEEYWEIRNRGVQATIAGDHWGNKLGNLILDKQVTDIALVVPDEFFWFGKSCEQNWNESIWQEGFANLVTIRQSDWERFKSQYAGVENRLVIHVAESQMPGNLSNVFEVQLPDYKQSKQVVANMFADLFTGFYGATITAGDRLIVRALAEEGYTPDDVDLNMLEYKATRIVQENLYLRQPYVELGKSLLETRFNELQEEERRSPGAITRYFEEVKTRARQGHLESNIPGVTSSKEITTMEQLATAIQEAADFAKSEGRQFVPFIYLEGSKFYTLRDRLIQNGYAWVLQGTGDQHISYQQVLAQPDKYVVFFASFVPETSRPGLRAIGFAKAYLDKVSSHLIRHAFAEASFGALKSRGGFGTFLNIIDSPEKVQLFGNAMAYASPAKGSRLANGMDEGPVGEHPVVDANRTLFEQDIDFRLKTAARHLWMASRYAQLEGAAPEGFPTKTLDDLSESVLSLRASFLERKPAPVQAEYSPAGYGLSLQPVITAAEALKVTLTSAAEASTLRANADMLIKKLDEALESLRGAQQQLISSGSRMAEADRLIAIFSEALAVATSAFNSGQAPQRLSPVQVGDRTVFSPRLRDVHRLSLEVLSDIAQTFSSQLRLLSPGLLNALKDRAEALKAAQGEQDVKNSNSFGARMAEISPASIAWNDLPPTSVARLLSVDENGVPSNVFVLDGFPKTQDGETWPAALKRIIETMGALDMTSNQVLIDQLIQSGVMDERLSELQAEGKSAEEIYLALYSEAAREASRIFKNIHASNPGPWVGRVSQEASAQISDLNKLVAASKEIHEGFAQGFGHFTKVPNLATVGPKAVEKATAAGVDVNVTLIFNWDHYLDNAEAYIRGLETRVRRGEPIEDIYSVSSLFVSRTDSHPNYGVDQLIDAELKKPGPNPILESLKGKAAIAQAQFIYRMYESIFLGNKFKLSPRSHVLDKAHVNRINRLSRRFSVLKASGAKPQRLLIASSGVKNTAYHPLMYVLPFLGPHMLNTMPQATFEALSMYVSKLSDEDIARIRQRSLIKEGVPAISQTRDNIVIWENSLLDEGPSGKHAPESVIAILQEKVLKPQQTSLIEIGDQLRDAGAADFKRTEEKTIATIRERMDAVGSRLGLSDIEAPQGTPGYPLKDRRDYALAAGKPESIDVKSGDQTVRIVVKQDERYPNMVGVHIQGDVLNATEVGSLVELREQDGAYSTLINPGNSGSIEVKFKNGKKFSFYLGLETRGQKAGQRFFAFNRNGNEVLEIGKPSSQGSRMAETSGQPEGLASGPKTSMVQLKEARYILANDGLSQALDRVKTERPNLKIILLDKQMGSVIEWQLNEKSGAAISSEIVKRNGVHVGYVLFLNQMGELNIWPVSHGTELVQLINGFLSENPLKVQNADGSERSFVLRFIEMGAAVEEADVTIPIQLTDAPSPENLMGAFSANEQIQTMRLSHPEFARDIEEPLRAFLRQPMPWLHLKYSKLLYPKDFSRESAGFENPVVLAQLDWTPDKVYTAASILGLKPHDLSEYDHLYFLETREDQYEHNPLIKAFILVNALENKILALQYSGEEDPGAGSELKAYLERLKQWNPKTKKTENAGGFFWSNLTGEKQRPGENRGDPTIVEVLVRTPKDMVLRTNGTDWSVNIGPRAENLVSLFGSRLADAKGTKDETETSRVLADWEKVGAVLAKEANGFFKLNPIIVTSTDGSTRQYVFEVDLPTEGMAMNPTAQLIDHETSANTAKVVITIGNGTDINDLLSVLRTEILKLMPSEARPKVIDLLVGLNRALRADFGSRLAGAEDIQAEVGRILADMDAAARTNSEPEIDSHRFNDVTARLERALEEHPAPVLMALEAGLSHDGDLHALVKKRIALLARKRVEEFMHAMHAGTDESAKIRQEKLDEFQANGYVLARMLSDEDATELVKQLIKSLSGGTPYPRLVSAQTLVEFKQAGILWRVPRNIQILDDVTIRVIRPVLGDVSYAINAETVRALNEAGLWPTSKSDETGPISDGTLQRIPSEAERFSETLRGALNKIFVVKSFISLPGANLSQGTFDFEKPYRELEAIFEAYRANLPNGLTVAQRRQLTPLVNGLLEDVTAVEAGNIKAIENFSDEQKPANVLMLLRPLGEAKNLLTDLKTSLDSMTSVDIPDNSPVLSSLGKLQRLFSQNRPPKNGNLEALGLESSSDFTELPETIGDSIFDRDNTDFAFNEGIKVASTDQLNRLWKAMSSALDKLEVMNYSGMPQTTILREGPAVIKELLASLDALEVKFSDNYLAASGQTQTRAAAGARLSGAQAATAQTQEVDYVEALKARLLDVLSSVAWKAAAGTKIPVRFDQPTRDGVPTSNQIELPAFIKSGEQTEDQWADSVYGALNQRGTLFDDPLLQFSANHNGIVISEGSRLAGLDAEKAALLAEVNELLAKHPLDKKKPERSGRTNGFVVPQSVVIQINPTQESDGVVGLFIDLSQPTADWPRLIGEAFDEADVADQILAKKRILNALNERLNPRVATTSPQPSASTLQPPALTAEPKAPRGGRLSASKFIEAANRILGKSSIRAVAAIEDLAFEYILKWRFVLADEPAEVGTDRISSRNAGNLSYDLLVSLDMTPEDMIRLLKTVALRWAPETTEQVQALVEKLEAILPAQDADGSRLADNEITRALQQSNQDSNSVQAGQEMIAVVSREHFEETLRAAIVLAARAGNQFIVVTTQDTPANPGHWEKIGTAEDYKNDPQNIKLVGDFMTHSRERAPLPNDGIRVRVQGATVHIKYASPKEAPASRQGGRLSASEFIARANEVLDKWPIRIKHNDYVDYQYYYSIKPTDSETQVGRTRTVSKGEYIKILAESPSYRLVSEGITLYVSLNMKPEDMIRLFQEEALKKAPDATKKVQARVKKLEAILTAQGANGSRLADNGIIQAAGRKEEIAKALGTLRSDLESARIVERRSNGTLQAGPKLNASKVKSSQEIEARIESLSQARAIVSRRSLPATLEAAVGLAAALVEGAEKKHSLVTVTFDGVDEPFKRSSNFLLQDWQAQGFVEEIMASNPMRDFLNGDVVVSVNGTNITVESAASVALRRESLRLARQQILAALIPDATQGADSEITQALRARQASGITGERSDEMTAVIQERRSEPKAVADTVSKTNLSETLVRAIALPVTTPTNQGTSLVTVTEPALVLTRPVSALLNVEAIRDLASEIVNDDGIKNLPSEGIVVRVNGPSISIVSSTGAPASTDGQAGGPASTQGARMSFDAQHTLLAQDAAGGGARMAESSRSTRLTATEFVGSTGSSFMGRARDHFRPLARNLSLTMGRIADGPLARVRQMRFADTLSEILVGIREHVKGVQQISILDDGGIPMLFQLDNSGDRYTVTTLPGGEALNLDVQRRGKRSDVDLDQFVDRASDIDAAVVEELSQVSQYAATQPVRLAISATDFDLQTAVFLCFVASQKMADDELISAAVFGPEVERKQVRAALKRLKIDHLFEFKDSISPKDGVSTLVLRKPSKSATDVKGLRYLPVDLPEGGVLSASVVSVSVVAARVSLEDHFHLSQRFVRAVKMLSGASNGQTDPIEEARQIVSVLNGTAKLSVQKQWALKGLIQSIAADLRATYERMMATMTAA